MDLTIFSEDNSPVKIYENKDEVYLVFKEHTLNLSKGLFGNNNKEDKDNKENKSE